MKPLSFILTTTFLNFLLMIPIVLVLIYFEIDDNEIGGVDIDNYSIWGLFIMAVIIAPILETAFGQILPINLSEKLFRNKLKFMPVLVSAVLFSLMHFGYSIWYSLLTLPLGILLAKTYVLFKERRESSFWMTTAVHSFRNLIAVVSIYIGLE